MARGHLAPAEVLHGRGRAAMDEQTGCMPGKDAVAFHETVSTLSYVQLWLTPVRHDLAEIWNILEEKPRILLCHRVYDCAIASRC